MAAAAPAARESFAQALWGGVAVAAVSQGGEAGEGGTSQATKLLPCRSQVAAGEALATAQKSPPGCTTRPCRHCPTGHSRWNCTSQHNGILQIPDIAQLEWGSG